MFSVMPQDPDDNPVIQTKECKRTPKSPSSSRQKYAEATDLSDSDEVSARFLEKPSYLSKEEAIVGAALQHSSNSARPYYQPAEQHASDEAWMIELEQRFQKRLDQQTSSLKQLLTEHHARVLEAVQTQPGKSSRVSFAPVHQVDAVPDIPASVATSGNAMSRVTFREGCETYSMPSETPRGNVDRQSMYSMLSEAPRGNVDRQSMFTVVNVGIPDDAPQTEDNRTSSPNRKDDDPESKETLRVPGQEEERGSLTRGMTSHTSSGVIPPKRASQVIEMQSQWEEHQRASIEKMVTQSKNNYSRKWVRTLVNKVRPTQAPSNLLARTTQGRWFMSMSALAILMNAIVIGLETDVGVRDAIAKKPESDAFVVINRGFTGFFCVELLIRIAAFRRKFFFGSEYMWNYFDTFLVITAIAEELLSSLNLSFVRILRLSRLVRAGRIIRVLHFFKSLRLMVICIFHSLASLFWALLLLFLIMYLFSICCLNGATAWLREHPDAAFAPPVDITDRDTLGDREMWETLHQMYKGLFRALLSLLMAISGGVDWYDAVRPFMGIDPIYTVMFLMYILFVVFGVLNVVTGVFVESAMQLRDRDLLIHSEMERTEEFLNDMRELFLEADADNTGRMCWNELKEYFKNERVVAYFTVHQLDVSDAYFIFKLLDTDGSGEIEIDEFAMGCMRLKGQAKTSDMLRIMQESAKINQQIFADLDHFNDQIVYVQNQLANLAAMSPTRRFSGKNLSRLLKGGSNNSLTCSSEGDMSASGGPDSPTAPQTDSPTLASPAVV